MQMILIFFINLLLFATVQGDIQKSIGIFTYKVMGAPSWDLDSIKSGIHGSEEAVIYMSQELANLGFKVLVFGDPSKNSQHSNPEANPRFVSTDFNDGVMLDIAISWRMPHVSHYLRTRAKKVYLWPHDTCSFLINEAEINGFDDVLWISEWQRQQWISINPGFSKFAKIFGNGIDPKQFKSSQEKINPHSCIYGSNYARGLEILLDIWPEVRRQFSDATLDIYYGWQHWGLLSQEKEEKMRKQIVELSSLGVKDHGLVGHEELNRAYEKASLWTYPCIGLEAFCITALRAQLAGAFPVIIEGSALKETVRHGFKCFTPEKYCETLIKAMHQAEKMTESDRVKMGEFVLQEYQWGVLAKKWKSLFESSVPNGEIYTISQQ